MLIGIIHNSARTDRSASMIQQMNSQGIRSYHIFPAILDRSSVKRGINLAHKSVVEVARDGKLDMVCVMEDDVLFTHPDSWKYFLSKIPKSFDIYLGGCYIPEFRDEKLYSWCGMHCYVVHSRFYDTFLNLPENEHIDRVLSGLGEYHLCQPMVAIQSNGYSSNTKKEEDYSPLLSGVELFKG